MKLPDNHELHMSSPAILLQVPTPAEMVSIAFNVIQLSCAVHAHFASMVFYSQILLHLPWGLLTVSHLISCHHSWKHLHPWRYSWPPCLVLHWHSLSSTPAYLAQAWSGPYHRAHSGPQTHIGCWLCSWHPCHLHGTLTHLTSLSVTVLSTTYQGLCYNFALRSKCDGVRKTLGAVPDAK